MRESGGAFAAPDARLPPDARTLHCLAGQRPRRSAVLVHRPHATRAFALDIVPDPGVPPLPPHITLAQPRSLTGALVGGEPEAGPWKRRVEDE